MSTQELFGDDSSSDEEVAPNPASSKKLAASENTKEEEEGDGKAEKDDDDAQEDEPEFDDTGVVGLKSSTLAGTKTSHDDDEDNDNDNEDDDEPKEKLAPTEWQVPRTEPVQTGELFLIKLPNLIAVQPEPYDEATYSAEKEQAQLGKAPHVIRHTTVHEKMQTNTRLVEWEDGSWTLHVGSDAHPVEAVQTATTGSSYNGLNGHIYRSHKATEEGAPVTVLSKLGDVASRLVVKPTMKSTAHKSLSVAVRSQTLQRARIANYTTTEDPERIKQERVKMVEEEQRKHTRSGGASRRSTPASRRPRMSHGYMEDDDDDGQYDTTRIRAMKRGVYEDDDDDMADDYGEDEDDEEDETFGRRRKKSKPTKTEEDDGSDDEDEFGGGDDDDEDEEAVVGKPKKKKAQTSVFDDDDSD